MPKGELLMVAGSVAFARLELDEAMYKLDEAKYKTALGCVRAAIALLDGVQSELEKRSIKNER